MIKVPRIGRKVRSSPDVLCVVADLLCIIADVLCVVADLLCVLVQRTAAITWEIRSELNDLIFTAFP